MTTDLLARLAQRPELLDHYDDPLEYFAILDARNQFDRELMLDTLALMVGRQHSHMPHCDATAPWPVSCACGAAQARTILRELRGSTSGEGAAL